MQRFVVIVAGLALAACSPQQAAAPAQPAAVAQVVAAVPQPEAGPPLVDGVYIVPDACPGEGCDLSGKIRALAATDLYDKPGKGASVTGRLPESEWVTIAGTEEHLVPRRGVVREARGSFAAGDVVYLLSSQGEGCMDAWIKGAPGSWCDPDTGLDPDSPVLDLDPLAADAAGLGLWVRVKRETGEMGWVKDVYDDFDCANPHDRGPECPAPG